MKILRHFALLLLAMGFFVGGYALGGFSQVVLWLMAGSSLVLVIE